MEKTKCLLIMSVIVAIALAAFYQRPIYAQLQGRVNIYAWTDKTSYKPGERGTLTIVVRNDRTDKDLILYNITIEYPWFAYTGKKWEGNDTIIVNAQLMRGEAKNYTKEFTVPFDGRVTACMLEPQEIVITAYVNELPYHYSPQENAVPRIYVVSPPPYDVAIYDWDKLLTLITVQVVLMIVCTIIIAAIIFFSTRRPRAIWVEEEEKEEKSK